MQQSIYVIMTPYFKPDLEYCQKAPHPHLFGTRESVAGNGHGINISTCFWRYPKTGRLMRYVLKPKREERTYSLVSQHGQEKHMNSIKFFPVSSDSEHLVNMRCDEQKVGTYALPQG